EEVDEVRLHEAQRAQIVELVLAKTKLRERAHLVADLVEVRPEVDALGAALELVFDLRAREVMQHDLHHGELVQVGVQQRLDDHPGSIVRCALCAAVTRSMPIRRWWRCSSVWTRRRSSSRATTSARAPRCSWYAAAATHAAWLARIAGG